jgi:hypothetical protein
MHARPDSNRISNKLRTIKCIAIVFGFPNAKRSKTWNAEDKWSKREAKQGREREKSELFHLTQLSSDKFTFFFSRIEALVEVERDSGRKKERSRLN